MSMLFWTVQATSSFLLSACLRDSSDIECGVDCGPFAHQKSRGNDFSSITKIPLWRV